MRSPEITQQVQSIFNDLKKCQKLYDTCGPSHWEEAAALFTQASKNYSLLSHDHITKSESLELLAIMKKVNNTLNVLLSDG